MMSQAELCAKSWVLTTASGTSLTKGIRWRWSKILQAAPEQNVLWVSLRPERNAEKAVLELTALRQWQVQVGNGFMGTQGDYLSDYE